MHVAQTHGSLPVRLADDAFRGIVGTLIDDDDFCGTRVAIDDRANAARQRRRAAHRCHGNGDVRLPPEVLLERGIPGCPEQQVAMPCKRIDVADVLVGGEIARGGAATVGEPPRAIDRLFNHGVEQEVWEQLGRNADHPHVIEQLRMNRAADRVRRRLSAEQRFEVGDAILARLASADRRAPVRHKVEAIGQFRLQEAQEVPEHRRVFQQPERAAVGKLADLLGAGEVGVRHGWGLLRSAAADHSRRGSG